MERGAGHAPFEENADRRAESAFWHEGMAFWHEGLAFPASLEGNERGQASDNSEVSAAMQRLAMQTSKFPFMEENLNVKMQCMRHFLFRRRRKKFCRVLTKLLCFGSKASLLWLQS